ncbi:unnamed protein product [Peniophora sp. CBMAI 1063]|nr:unnamed protein product [Peniophora sp. CBMAI 1063]
MPAARIIGERKGHYSLAPVEFISILLFAEDMYDAGRHVHDEPTRMADGIKELRVRLRQQFPGVLKSNKSVLGYGLSFVKGWMRTRNPLHDEDVKVPKTEPDTIDAVSRVGIAGKQLLGAKTKKIAIEESSVIDLTLDCAYPSLSTSNLPAHCASGSH